MSRWKRRFWTERRRHAKNEHRKRNVIMRLLWYNRAFVAGWRESNMNEGSCKFTFAHFAHHGFHSFCSAHLDRIWMTYCPKTAPKDWPLASISNPALRFTTVRVAFCHCSMKNRQRTPNGWNASAAICLPRSNRRVRSSATSELRWTRNWASHGFDTSSCCCTNVVFAWKNWNQVSLSISLDATRFQFVSFSSDDRNPCRKYNVGLVFAHSRVVHVTQHMGTSEAEEFGAAEAWHDPIVQQYYGIVSAKGIFSFAPRKSSEFFREDEKDCLFVSSYFRRFYWKECAERLSHWSQSHWKQFYRYQCDH